MAGPWEKYASNTADGPWSKYASSDTPPSNNPADYPQGKSAAEAERMRREFLRQEKGNKTTGEKLQAIGLPDYLNPGLPTERATSLGDFTKRVLPESAGKLPARLAMGAYEAVKGQTDPIVEGFITQFGNPSYSIGREMQRNAVGTLRGLADAVVNPTGLMGLEKAKESWLTDPAGSALAVTPMVKPSLRALKSGAGTAADVTRAGAQAAAGKLTDMTLKQGTTLRPEIRRQNVSTALEGGYLPNAKGVDKLAADIAATESRLQSGIQAGESAGVRGRLDRAVQNIESLRAEANRSANPERSNALLDAEIERLAKNPMMDEAGTIPAADIQRMKVEQGRDIKYQQKTGQAPDAFQAKIDKARVRGLKEELEAQLFDVFPELKETNQQLGNMYKLQDVLERAANRIENNQGFGIGLPIKSGAGAGLGSVFGPTGAAIGAGIGTMIGIIEHPAVAPRLGQMLYRASKGSLTKGQAMKMAANRLDAIKAKLYEDITLSGGIIPPKLQEQYGKLRDKLKDDRGLVGVDINYDSSPTYYRRTSKPNIYNNVDWAMFADDPQKVAHYGDYEHSIKLNDIPAEKTISASDPKFKRAVEKALISERQILREYQSTPKKISSELDPSDIVDSAGGWDNAELVSFIWDKVLEPMGKIAVTTNDGLLLFDNSFIKEPVKKGKHNL